ncbi:unnamed protein product, partial [Medioppia subpectinata]
GTISEGDIVSYKDRDKDTDQTKSMTSDEDLWPNGIIPFMFHKSIDKDNKELITEAIKHWEENTCIRFRRKNSKDVNFVRFRGDTSGCWSSVGRQYEKIGPQDISLGSGCFKVILANLVTPAKPEVGLQYEDTRNEGDVYDYKSIMHYPAWAFSKSPLSKSVLVAKHPFNQYLIDEDKESLSFRGVSGVVCESVDETKKLDNIEPKCGGNITQEGVHHPQRHQFLNRKSSSHSDHIA